LHGRRRCQRRVPCKSASETTATHANPVATQTRSISPGIRLSTPPSAYGDRVQHEECKKHSTGDAGEDRPAGVAFGHEPGGSDESKPP
jgi:hypothetical protein